MAFASWKSGKLTRKLSPSDTSLYLNTDLGITAGRLYAKNDTQVEFLNFTGKTTISATEWQYTGLTRQLSQTAVPATSAGAGYTWLANQDFIQDMMHDQIMDPSLFVQVTRYANATARDVAIPVPVNGMEVYLISEWYMTDYVSGAWVQRASGAVANASTTVAGKVEVATQTEVNNGTAIWWTGALLAVTPNTLAVYVSAQVASGIASANARTVTTASVSSGTPSATVFSSATTFSRFWMLYFTVTSASSSWNWWTSVIQTSPVWAWIWTDSVFINSANNTTSLPVVMPIQWNIDVRIKAIAPVSGGSASITVNATYYL